MTYTLNPALLQPLFALIGGIAILFEPKILNYVVAILLIVFGALGVLALL